MIPLGWSGVQGLMWRKIPKQTIGGMQPPKRQGADDQRHAASHWLKHLALWPLPSSPAECLSPCLTSLAMQCEAFAEPIKPPHREKVKEKVACSFVELPKALLKQSDDKNPGHFWCQYCKILLRDEGQVTDHIQGRKHAKCKRRTINNYPDEGIEFAPVSPPMDHLFQ